VDSEWNSVITVRHNVLLQGSDDATARAVARLQPHLMTPILWRQPGQTLELGGAPPRTMVLHDVAGLSASEQTALRLWLDESPRPLQIVATVNGPLFPLIARGLFDQSLYYRLNVMLLSVDRGN
jgi:hypothetical protein